MTLHTGNGQHDYYRHIAAALKLPIGLACIDYVRREVGIMEWITPTGIMEQDLAKIRGVLGASWTFQKFPLG